MKNLLKTEWRLILFGFLMTFWSAPGQTFLISLFSGQIRAELSLTHGEFGLYYSVGTLLSALVVMWSGAQIDRIELRRFTIVITAGLIMGCLALSFSQGPLTLIISLFLLRHFGQGLMFLTASTTVVRYLDANKGKASAISSMGYSLSEAVFPKLLIILIAWLGWRQSWQLLAVVVLVIVVPSTLFLLRDHQARHKRYLTSLFENNDSGTQSVRRHWRRAQVLKDIRIYLFLPNIMAQTLLFTGFIFHQVHLVESKGWLLENWATYFALYAAVAIAMKFISGFLVDRFSASAMVPLHTVPLLIALALLSSSNAPWIAIAFLVLLAMTSGMQATLSTPFLSEQYGNQYLGGIKSMMSAVMVFISALSPFAMGWMIDHGISLEAQARMGVVFVIITITLATIGYFISRRSANI